MPSTPSGVGVGDILANPVWEAAKLRNAAGERRPYWYPAEPLKLV